MILHGPAHFPEPRHVLFIQHRRIGDVLLCTPALRALARRFPDARIDFLVEPPAEEVLRGHPLLSRLLVAPRDKKLSSFWRLTRELRRVRYDWVIDFFSNPRSAQFTFVTGAPLRIGLDRRGRRWAYTHHIVEEAEDLDLYAVDLRLKVLAQLDVPCAGRELEIYSDRVDATQTARVNEFLKDVPQNKPLVAVATGTSNPAKRYPADLTARVITLLQQQGCTIVLTSGPYETELGQEILSHLDTPVPFLSNARVPTLAALYRRVQLYVGPDSGTKHVAAACRLPTVTIFSLGRPYNWNDVNDPRNIVLVAPCDVRPHCIEAECARRQCLRKIPPEDVAAAALKLLK
jgi:ADP-heptose:LPS heptosyltransferase